MSNSHYAIHHFDRLVVVAGAGIPVSYMLAIVELFKVACRCESPVVVYDAGAIGSAANAIARQTGNRPRVIMLAAPKGHTVDQIVATLEAYDGA